MSAFLKALGIYLAVVAAIGAWVWGVVWAAVTEQSRDIQTLTIMSPLLLILAVWVFGLVVYLPIVSMYEHFKGAKK